MLGKRIIPVIAVVLAVGGGLVGVAAPAFAAAAPGDVESALPPGGSFIPVTPFRAVDTRGTGGPVSGVTLGNGTLSGVDAGQVAALLLNVTVVDAKGSGFVVVGSGTGTSNGNFIAGAASATLALGRLNAQGAVPITLSTPANLVVDVQGYVTTAEAADNNSYTPLSSPRRIADSRSRSGLVPFTPNSRQTLDVGGRGQLPDGATAVIANVTIASASASTYLTAWAGGSGQRPRPSTVNAGRGEIVANRALIPLAPDGTAALYNSAGTTDVVVDVVGYLSYNGNGSYYTPATPSRLADTIGAGTVVAPTVDAGASGTAVLAPSLRDIAPTTAVWLTLVGDHPAGRGYLAARPGGTPSTGTSDLDLVPGRAVANAGPATLSASGTVTVQSVPSSRIVVDLSGWFQRRPSAATVSAGVVYSGTRYPDYTDAPVRHDTVPTALPAYFVDGVFAGNGERTSTNGYAVGPDGSVQTAAHGIARPGAVTDWGAVSGIGGTAGTTALATAGERTVAAVYALRNDGTVLGFSSNQYGELGAAPSATITYPLSAQVVQLPDDATVIGAAEGIGYAVLADGSVYSWGRATTSQLGRTPTASPWLPAAVTGFGDTPPTHIAGDGDITFAIDATGRTWSWGAPIGGDVQATPTPYTTGCTVATGLHADASGVWEMCAGGVVHLSDHGALGPTTLIQVGVYRIAAAAGLTGGIRALGASVIDISNDGEVRYEAGFSGTDVQGIRKINGSPGVQITFIGNDA